MPFLILNELKQSNIHGLGVFSLENIRKGTTEWMIHD
jgi:SET domain-containing protein